MPPLGIGTRRRARPPPAVRGGAGRPGGAESRRTPGGGCYCRAAEAPGRKPAMGRYRALLRLSNLLEGKNGDTDEMWTWGKRGSPSWPNLLLVHLTSQHNCWSRKEKHQQSQRPSLCSYLLFIWLPVTATLCRFGTYFVSLPAPETLIHETDVRTGCFCQK